MNVKSIRSLTSALLALPLALLLLTTPARATSVMFGLLGSYSQFTLPGTTQDSIFRGPGYGFEFSYKQVTGNSSSSSGGGAGFGTNDSGFDFSIHLVRDFGSNVGAGIDESLSTVAYGGAVDYHVGHLLMGFQYQHVGLKISGPVSPTPTDLKFGGFAGRVGFSVNIYNDVGLTLGGLYQLGTAYAKPNGRTSAQPINQLSGYLNLSFPILSTGSLF